MKQKLLTFCLSDQSKLIRWMMIASFLLQIGLTVLISLQHDFIKKLDTLTTGLLVVSIFMTVPIAFFSSNLRTTLKNIGYTLLPVPLFIGLVLFSVSLLGFAIKLKQGTFTNPFRLQIFESVFVSFMILISIVLPAVAGARIAKMALEYLSTKKSNKEVE